MSCRADAKNNFAFCWTWQIRSFNCLVLFLQLDNCIHPYLSFTSSWMPGFPFFPMEQHRAVTCPGICDFAVLCDIRCSCWAWSCHSCAWSYHLRLFTRLGKNRKINLHASSLIQQTNFTPGPQQSFSCDPVSVRNIWLMQSTQYRNYFADKWIYMKLVDEPIWGDDKKAEAEGWTCSSVLSRQYARELRTRNKAGTLASSESCSTTMLPGLARTAIESNPTANFWRFSDTLGVDRGKGLRSKSFASPKPPYESDSASNPASTFVCVRITLSRVKQSSDWPLRISLDWFDAVMPVRLARAYFVRYCMLDMQLVKELTHHVSSLQSK